ncbi:hypothetical protein [Nonomuraea sp. NPDC002799]
MEFNGLAHSPGQMYRLACAAGGMADDVSGTQTKFERSSGAVRAALGDDDYGHRYWQVHSERLGNIGSGLELLASALRKQESRVQEASQRYEDCEDASTLRAS